MEAGTKRQMVGFVREMSRDVQSYVYGVKALRDRCLKIKFS